MTRIQRRIAVSCVDLDGRTAVLFYDLVNKVVLDDPSDFLWSLSHDRQLDWKTVSDAAFTVRRFLEHLDRGEHRKQTHACRDDDIERFRDAELKFVMSSNKSKQKERTAKNTVNVRVRLVYRYLTWLQAHGRTRENLIGRRGCRVLSSLPDDIRADDAALFSMKRGAHSSVQKARYPLAYQRIGSKSKHATKYVPSESIRFAAISSIHDSASSDYLAHRNALIIDIANIVGWRRESINSITRGQVAEALKSVASADYASICPSVQKFGYVEAFDVPGWLVERMDHFSRTYLEPMAKVKRWRLLPSTAFFLGVNGRPLKDRSITKIVSTAMRAAGAPRFTSVHALRRKFTNDEIADETKYRLNAGLDTTAASIASSVSISLGQHNPDSVYAYVSRSMSVERLEVDAQRRKHMDLLEQQVVAMKEKVRELEELTAKLLQAGSDQPVANSSKSRR
ncbi:hypothetical protein [Comamonas testosteroni]|uniref:hypothetical protein n=1 Tax=Comamonas testosteroni TaxID=285 RepID=UPI0026EFA4C8|nr:hypothetical protein [Comamonas testosteroni]